jgi:hypothetical protein
MNDLADARTFMLGISAALLLGWCFLMAWRDHDRR